MTKRDKQRIAKAKKNKDKAMVIKKISKGGKRSVFLDCISIELVPFISYCEKCFAKQIGFPHQVLNY